MRSTLDRLSVLIGSKSALSQPVLWGLAISGYLLSFILIRRIPGHSFIWGIVVTLGVTAISISVLVLARLLGNSVGWNRAHPVFVVSALIAASVTRSVANWLSVNWWSGGQEIDSSPLGRSVSSLLVFVSLGLIMAASAQLAHERTQANSALLMEQARLRRLIETSDAELHRSEIELRERAHLLLQPTVDEIRDLISGEISQPEARALAERIDIAVNDVVRPASRELALTALEESEQIVSEAPSSRSLLKDQMDITRAIRPWWLVIAWWPVLLLGAIALGANSAALGRSLLLVVFFLPLIWAVKLLWPRRFRMMSVARGLVVLLIVYSILNIAFQPFFPNGDQAITGSETWAANLKLGILIRVALAMLVSILAVLSIRGEQIQASLMETNTALEELISRIKRETWLLHRSVSLAVHGTVQSALISTAMRLTAENRTPETVVDARRRLDEALKLIRERQGVEISVPHAMTDLNGLWSPVVRFSSDISPAATQRLATDTGLSRCAIEICREATSNAIRHGNASSVKIRIATVGELLEIRVTDDGDGPSSDVVAGLGSQMYDETCLRWQLDCKHDGGSELIAVLA